MGDHEMMVKIFPAFYVNFCVIISILPLVYLYFMQTANQSSSTQSYANQMLARVLLLFMRLIFNCQWIIQFSFKITHSVVLETKAYISMNALARRSCKLPMLSESSPWCQYPPCMCLKKQIAVVAMAILSFDSCHGLWLDPMANGPICHIIIELLGRE